MAFWPSRGTTLSSIDYERKNVGVVQYFVRHSVHFKRESRIDVLEHVFSYVKWKKVHPDHDFYGRSAIVSENMFELPSIYSFLPAQRIACHAAHTVMRVNLGHIEA